MIDWSPMGPSMLNGAAEGDRIIGWLHDGNVRIFQLGNWGVSEGMSWGCRDVEIWKTYSTAELVSLCAFFSAVNRPVLKDAPKPSPIGFWP